MSGGPFCISPWLWLYWLYGWGVETGGAPEVGGPLAGPEMQDKWLDMPAKKQNKKFISDQNVQRNTSVVKKNCNHGINHTMVVFILQTQMLHSQLKEYMLPLTRRDPASVSLYKPPPCSLLPHTVNTQSWRTVAPQCDYSHEPALQIHNLCDDDSVKTYVSLLSYLFLFSPFMKSSS